MEMASSKDTLNQHFAQCTLLMITESQTSIPGSQGESHPLRSKAHHPSRPLVLKGQHSASPLQLRCKKSQSQIGAGLAFVPRQQQPVASVTRRNERERNRVRQVNAGFQTLRQHVPNGAANGKLSKVETLRSAVEYIQALQLLLDESNTVSAGFQSSGVPSPGSSGSPLHSTCSSSLEEGAIYEHWSPEEQEIIDFTTWIHRY